MEEHEYKRDNVLEQEISNVLRSNHDLYELLDKSTIILNRGDEKEVYPNPMIVVGMHKSTTTVVDVVTIFADFDVVKQGKTAPTHIKSY